MAYEQNVIGQNGMDKMVRQNGTNKAVPIKIINQSINPVPTDNMIFHQSRFHLDPFTFPLCA